MPSRRRLLAGLPSAYLAISSSALVSQQAAEVAASHTHNPHLFTAHCTADGHRALKARSDVEDDAVVAHETMAPSGPVSSASA
ncbi:MAG: hypothetical protein AAGE94_02495 [Acidobacteriota bacterium]